MRKSRFSEEQTIGILKEKEAGVKLASKHRRGDAMIRLSGDFAQVGAEGEQEGGNENTH